MHKKILMPLDGTSVSEAALDQIDEVNFGDCETILLRVIPPVKGVIVDNDHRIYVDEQMAYLKKEALDYLNCIARKLELKGFNARCEVRFGQAAEEIANFCEEEGIGLIAMATHGRSGISRLIHGSILEQVSKLVEVPILAVKATEAKKFEKAA